MTGNTAPKLSEAIETLRKYRNNGSVRIWDMDAALDVVLAALAPPSGEGVGTLNVWRHVGGDDGECEYHFSGKIPPGAYVIVPAKRTTPQSAPVDGSATCFVQRTAPEKIYLNVFDDKQYSVCTFPRDADEIGWSEKQQLSVAVPYVRADLAMDSTPPPASQERGGKPWRCEWEGSGPQRGWHIVEAVRLSNNERVAYLSQEIDSTAVDAIVAAHNATQRPAECADGCPPQQVCDFCQGTGGVDASPPSSAAEASINPPEIDSKLIPDAAEQAKPDEGPRCYQCMQKVSVLFSDGRCVKCTREVPTCGCYPPCDGPCHVEQAQAGESYLRKFQDDNTHFVESLPRKISEPDRPWFVNERGTELRGHAYEFSGDTHVVPVAVAQAEIDRLNAVLLRRLAGGVTVDDAMTERACICHYPRWEVFSDPTRIAARASMRRLLVAALGAK